MKCPDCHHSWNYHDQLLEGVGKTMLPEYNPYHVEDLYECTAYAGMGDWCGCHTRSRTTYRPEGPGGAQVPMPDVIWCLKDGSPQYITFAGEDAVPIPARAETLYMMSEMLEYLHHDAHYFVAPAPPDGPLPLDYDMWERKMIEKYGPSSD